LISTLMWSRMAPDTADLSVRFSKLYQTSISPERVRTYSTENKMKNKTEIVKLLLKKRHIPPPKKKKGFTSMTSMIVCPRKSSDSRVNFWRIFDLKSLSSSQTRTLIRSEELWHSLSKWTELAFEIQKALA
jgi:hypothetical protein